MEIIKINRWLKVMYWVFLGFGYIAFLSEVVFPFLKLIPENYPFFRLMAFVVVLLPLNYTLNKAINSCRKNDFKNDKKLLPTEKAKERVVGLGGERYIVIFVRVGFWVVAQILVFCVYYKSGFDVFLLGFLLFALMDAVLRLVFPHAAMIVYRSKVISVLCKGTPCGCPGATRERAFWLVVVLAIASFVVGCRIAGYL